MGGVQPGAVILWGIGLITAGMTAFYMFRQLFMVFHGECRADDHAKAHLHESPAVMTLPLIVLAIGSIFTGWLGAPNISGAVVGSTGLQPMFGAGAGARRFGDDRNSSTLVNPGGGGGWEFMPPTRSMDESAAERERQAAGAEGLLYRLSLTSITSTKFTTTLFVRPFTACSRFFAEFVDPRIIDGMVNGVAVVHARAQLGVVRLQTGNVQHYATGLLVGTLAFLALFPRSVLIMFGLPIGHISILLAHSPARGGVAALAPRRQTRTLFALASFGWRARFPLVAENSCSLRRHHRRNAVHRDARLDARLRHSISRRRRRHQPVPGLAHDLAHADRHSRVLVGKGPRQRIFDFHAAPGDRHARRLCRAGSFSLLCFLGSHARADVFPDRRVGRRRGEFTPRSNLSSTR